MQQQFKQILEEISRGVYEKDTEIGLSLLAAIAGESVLLLGPPGVAKSMVARRVKCAFGRSKAFEYLMSRFSTPDEIFGPVSISRLKTSDTYERNTEGFMPSADVVFLDEIWKAGPAILNTLLTIINEKVFRNGREEVRVPMKLLIGASNELPADGEGLEALWDRFLVRIVSNCVTDEENFYRILRDEQTGGTPTDVKVTHPITARDYAAWQKSISQMELSDEVLRALTAIRRRLKALKLKDTDESANRTHRVYVSDRRWQHIAHLLRASAYVHGRTQVELDDLIVLNYCLWNDPEEIDAVRGVVVDAMLTPYRNRLTKLIASIRTERKHMAIRTAQEQIEREDYHRDDKKQLFDGFYYLIDKYDTGNTYIFFVDYKNMQYYDRNNAPMEGIIYPDPHQPGRTIIRTMSDHLGLNSNGVGAMRIKMYRDDDNIYLNGVKYPIHRLPEGVEQPRVQAPKTFRPVEEYEASIENLAAGVYDFTTRLAESNLFASKDDVREIVAQRDELNHEIAILRVDIEKLLYGES